MPAPSNCSTASRTLLRSIGVTAICSMLTVAALARNQPSRAEQQIDYRQSLFAVIGGNFAPLAPMIEGKAPYDADQFAIRARRVEFIAQMLTEAFPLESRQGAPTDAKPEIWSQRKEFNQLLKELQTKSAQLSHAAAGKDMQHIRPAFVAVADACRKCHDKFVVEHD